MDIENGEFLQFAARLRSDLLLVVTVTCVVIGVIAGCVLRMLKPSDTAIELIAFPGDILMRLLKMLIIPLIVSSLVSGMARLDLKSSGRMGWHSLAYYLTTTFIAAVTGIILVLAIHPGNSGIKEDFNPSAAGESVNTLDAVMDLIR